MNSKFITVLESLKTSTNETLVNTILEGYGVIFEALALSVKQVPAGIRSWVTSTLRKDIQKYSIEQKGSVDIHMPWHEGDREYYQMFQLNDGGDAQPVDGVQFQRSGLEGDGSPATGFKIGGKVQIPSGYVLVCAGIYPMRATIYTADDATKMLPPSDNKFELSDDEAVALYQSKYVTSPYRIKFPDPVYQGLISKGLMKANKAITIDGTNFIQTLGDRLKEIDASKKYGYRFNFNRL